MTDPAAFRAAIARAAATAASRIVTFGIQPDGPETGYGYIQAGEALSEGVFKVNRFAEKPSRDVASQYLAEGGYSWNGGIFAFRAGDFLTELAAHRPDIVDAVRKAVAAGHADGHRFHPDAASFAEAPSESIDYAVMEHTTRAAVVPAAMAWSDIGNWSALHEARAKDGVCNSVVGRAELVDCRNVLVESDGPRVSVIGLDDVIVVVDGDEILVTSAAGVQKVGKLSGAVNQ